MQQKDRVGVALQFALSCFSQSHPGINKSVSHTPFIENSNMCLCFEILKLKQKNMRQAGRGQAVKVKT